MSETKLDLATMRGKMELVHNGTPTTQVEVKSVESDEDECRAFGFLRGIRDRALSLELRFADGNSESHAYNWLGPIKYNPSAGLLLKFVGDMIYLVLLEGSNLNALVNGAVSLYSGILRHRVTWIAEMTRHQTNSAEAGEVTIEQIRTLAHSAGEEPQDVAWLKPFKDKHSAHA
jgi:hypothetical protein